MSEETKKSKPQLKAEAEARNARVKMNVELKSQQVLRNTVIDLMEAVNHLLEENESLNAKVEKLEKKK